MISESYFLGNEQAPLLLPLFTPDLLRLPSLRNFIVVILKTIKAFKLRETDTLNKILQNSYQKHNEKPTLLKSLMKSSFWLSRAISSCCSVFTN